MNGVTLDRFKDLLRERGHDVYDLSFQGWHVPVLYGLLNLAASRPDFHEAAPPVRDFITTASWWCEEKFKQWGLSPEEIEYLKQLPENGVEALREMEW